MAKSKPFSLSAMVDTEGEGSEHEIEATMAGNSNNENVVVGIKKKGGRPKANAKKFTRPKRLSNESVAPTTDQAKKSKAGRKKAPLTETEDNEQTINPDDIDDFAHSDPAEVLKESKKPKTSNKRKATEDIKGRAAKIRNTKQSSLQKADGEFQYTPTHEARKGRFETSLTAPHQIAQGKSNHKAVEIPETQSDNTLGDPIANDDELEDETSSRPSLLKGTSGHRAVLKQQLSNLARRRAASPSGADQGLSDPALRRKLGDMTRQYETMSQKYRDLRDIGIKEAEKNYENLRKQTEINRKAASDLIASLKNEIAAQKAIAQEAHGLRDQLLSRDADLEESRQNAEEVSRSLTEVQNENKVLHAKLGSLRGASVPGERTPGSAMRNKSQLQAKTSSTDMAVAQLKDDLYSDLTGLILRGVDVGSEVDTFDCIQTGRNGTLHFKLGVSKDPEESYEDVEFQYTPRLDSNRDRSLIELLPEYLTEEITFSRLNAAPFYARIMDTLMKKRVVESME